MTSRGDTSAAVHASLHDIWFTAELVAHGWMAWSGGCSAKWKAFQGMLYAVTAGGTVSGLS